MDVGTSKGLESFLAFLRETTERHRMAEADRAEAEAATQDLLHALELGNDKAPGRTAGRSKGRPHYEEPVPLLRLRAHGTHGAGPPHQRHVLGRPSR